MKYTCTVDIDLPLAKVAALWDDENNFKEWQDGFKKIEHVSGAQGAVGSQAKIYLDDGKRKIELLETITSNNLPEEKSARYVHEHMTNTQTTRFQSIGGNQTRYLSEVEYTEFHGFLPKLMAKFFPSVFKKQSQKWMNQFKEFAEGGNESSKS